MRPFFISLCFFCLSGCGDASFSGKGVGGKALNKSSEEKKEEPVAPSEAEKEASQGTAPEDSTGENGSQTNTDGKAPTVIGEKETDEALVHCLSKWKDHPFDQNAIRSSVTIEIDDAFNGNNGIVYVDEEITTVPVLKYITYSGKNLNQGKIELKNPMGWYCLALNGKAMNNLQVNVHCDAKLATFSSNSQVANKMVINQNCP